MVLVEVGIGVAELTTAVVGGGVGVLPQADSSNVKLIDAASMGRRKFFIYSIYH